MLTADTPGLELAESWVDGDASARRSSAATLYAEADVVTRYEAEVQPDGERERRPLEA